jgi:WD40 repeat protein
VNYLKYSPDGRTLYVAQDKSVFCIDTQSHRVLDRYKTDRLIFSFDFNPEFTKIIMGVGPVEKPRKLMQVWNMSPKKHLQDYLDGDPFDEEDIRCVYFLSDHSCVACGVQSAFLVNLPDGNCEMIYTTNGDHVSYGDLTGMAAAKDGKQIALCGYFVFGILNLETKKFRSINNPFDTHSSCQVHFAGRNNELFFGQESKVYIWQSESHSLELWHDLLNP